ncbi:MAG TPA: siderophore-interacting protein [Marmoricola sp.]|nr:siderophore-interacting protein [Marmoricola sp.]
MTTQIEDRAAVVQAPPVLVTEARVRRTERISPHFVRVVLESPDFVDLAAHEGFDTRFKLVLPGPGGMLPPIPDPVDGYYQGLLAMPDEHRAAMRTYTIREVREEDGQVLLVVDLVVHQPPEAAGPACRWAIAARPGDVVQVIAPHRRSIAAGTPYGGSEFDPGTRRRLLLVGDETALPAITRILLDLARGHVGTVFLEVPGSADVLDVPVPPGMEIVWLPRGREPYGAPLVEAVRRHLGLAPRTDAGTDTGTDTDGPDLPEQPATLDIDVWETPRYSAAGEDLAVQRARRTVGTDLEDLYAWIAGESWMVKVLRRALVREVGVDRDQVAFMGYWREGVAMRS